MLLYSPGQSRVAHFPAGLCMFATDRMIYTSRIGESLAAGQQFLHICSAHMSVYMQHEGCNPGGSLGAAHHVRPALLTDDRLQEPPPLG